MTCTDIRIHLSPPDFLNPVSITIYQWVLLHYRLPLISREVHVGCVFQKSLKLLLRPSDFSVRRLDVAALGDSDVSRPQDSLNYLVWYAKLMEICIEKDEDLFLVGFPVQ